ncbi:hypothetical protein [Paracoccus jiaweipingae]|uniref:hypothetical protein n=1 Tax=Paracoccus sp. p2-l61 TaxID=3366950 RepID=UPI0037A637A7
MPDDTDPKAKIVQLMKKASPEKTAPRQRRRADFVVNGDGNVVAGRDVVQLHQPIIRHETKVTPGDGVVSAEQKARIQQLVKDWMLSHNAVKKRPLTFQAAYSKMNATFRVNSYHELPAEKFNAVVKWLQQQKAMIQSMPSAPRKDPTVATSAIRFIKARCKQLGEPTLYVPYIERTFGVSSLADLDAAQLQRVRGWVAKKRV